MTRAFSQDNHSGRLAEYLTELVTRLRRFSSPDGGRLVLPPFLTRLETASRLLAHAARNDQERGFSLLATALAEYIAMVEETPGRHPGELDRPLELLTVHLESLLGNIDAGESIAAGAADSRWTGILARFESAGTPLAVMDDLELVLAGWEEAGTGSRIGPVEAEELHRRWSSVRGRGNRLFEKPILASGSGPSAPLTVQGREAICGLLMDSPFQKDQVLRKIQESGSRVVVLDGPEQAAELAAEETGALVLLGDNLEPTRNLESILAELAPRIRESLARCVLVCGSRTGSNEQHCRAAGLGADGSWAPPYDLQDLQKVLNGSSG